MPQPEKGDGPWAEAIRHWLDKRGWKQADLLRAALKIDPKTIDPATKKEKAITKNTISTAFLGRDCNTFTLRVIAKAFDVELDEVLVSPNRKSALEEKKQWALEIAERVTRSVFETPPPSRTNADIAMQHSFESMEHAERELKKDLSKTESRKKETSKKAKPKKQRRKNL